MDFNITESANGKKTVLMRHDQISYNPPRACDALSDPVTSFGNIK
jgi:hypothetical protein